jgi:integrase
MSKKVTDAFLRDLKYKPVYSKGPKLEGLISKRTGKPMESRAGQLLPNRYPDRDAMYIHVSQAGTVTFRFDFRWPKTPPRRKQCAVHGRYPVMTLAEARDAHRDFLRQIGKGINPLDVKRIERQQESLPDDFKSVAERWFKKNKPGKSESWASANRRYLDAAYPLIGSRKIQEITQKDISAIISPVEASGRAITAEKMRQCYAMVWDHAADKPEFLVKAGENPARALSVDVPKAKHHASLAINEVPLFLKAVDADTGHEEVKLAIKLLFLCLTRKMELLDAKWTELDLENSRWQIPPERMKGDFPHVVPLSRQAVAMFRRLKELAGDSEYVFRFRAKDTLRRVYERTGYAGKATPHGCRSTASTALNELGYSKDWIEKQLAHTEADEVRASYNFASYMGQRRKMLQDWADAIDRICAGLPLVVEPETEKKDNVIPLHAAA